MEVCRCNAVKSVIVVGAGVIGLLTAYFLRQHGLDVKVVDSESGPAQGASYGNGGYLQTAVTDPWNAPGVVQLFAKAWLNGLSGRGDNSAFLTRTSALPGLLGWGLKFLKHANLQTYLSHTVKNMHLAQYSVRLIKKIAGQESISFSQSDAGALIIYKDEKGLSGYADIAKHVAEKGSRFELLDRDALLQKEPSLRSIAEELVGAVYFPDDYAGNCREFCKQLVTVMERQGVEFEFNRRVSGINSNGNAVDVRTDSGRHVADAVVVAAGIFSKQLIRPLGVKLPIAPAKGFSISVPMGDWPDRPRHTIVDMSQHAGVNPLGDVLRVAGAAEFTGMKPGIGKARIEYLVGLVKELFAEFADTIDGETCDPWGGHRPLSADGLPMVSATHIDNVFVNTGHGGMGWSQSAGSGKALADLIAGVAPKFGLSDFSIERFN